MMVHSRVCKCFLWVATALMPVAAKAGYKATYGGRVYDSEVHTWVWNHAATRTRRQYPMCHDIVAQWHAAEARQRQAAQISMPVQQSADLNPGTESQTEYRLETRQETYTEYITQCQYIRWGRKVGCTQVPVQRTRQVTVRVPIRPITVAQPKPTNTAKPIPQPTVADGASNEAWGPMPEDALPLLTGLLGLSADARFIDIGAGDGRVVKAVLQAGCKDATGIELDRELANRANRLVDPLGGTVYYGDALAEGSRALYKDRTHAFIHQQPDLTAELVAILPRGIKLVSFAHEMPGVYCQRHDFGEFVFFSGVSPGSFPAPEAPIAPHLANLPALLEPKPMLSEPVGLAPPLFGLSQE